MSVRATAVFIIGILTGAWAWWQFAWPILIGSASPRHADHFSTVYAHMLGGTAAAMFGLILSLRNRHQLSGITVATGSTTSPMRRRPIEG